MKMNLQISVALLMSVMSFSACSELKTNDCVSCAKKTIPESVKPDSKPVADLKSDIEPSLALATKGPLVITKEVGRSPATSSKESYQKGFCSQYEMAQDTVDVETLTEDMESCPYAANLKEFWTTPACHAPMKNDTNVPIIFNTASDPVRSENFPKTVHDYFIDEKKDPESWLKTINTTTNDGYTFLDYLQYNIEKGNYSLKKTSDAAQRIIAYVCKNGGVYSKYKNTIKCP